MDHHLLPKNPTSAEIRVPYVCAQPIDGLYKPYDGGPFLTYPARVGKEYMIEGGDGQSSVRLKQRFYSASKEDEERFIQSWLFFGILCSFMKSVYNANDYIKEQNGETFINTEKLTQRMSENWGIRSESATPAEKARQWQSAAHCLGLSFKVINGCRQDFDWRIRLSITSVLELYARAVNGAFLMAGVKFEATAPSMFFPEFPNQTVQEEMLRVGWCPSEIAPISHRFRSLQTMIFLSRLNRTLPRKDHTHCSATLCHCYQIDIESYSTAHVCKSGLCGSIGVNNAEIERILSTNALPILKISRSTDNPTIEVVPSSDLTPFVALSHVWADGLGNPRENELPKCQVLRIGALVDSLHEIISSSSKETPAGPFHVWIDTLCCPVRPEEAKLLSISRMRETYSDAAHVLVLDRNMTLVRYCEIDGVEAFLRVFNSAWISRLWCLQEGVLPQDLWIQFSDQAVNLDHLYGDIMKLPWTNIPLMCIVQDLTLHFQSLRRRGVNGNAEATDTVGSRLYSLDQALACRSVSVASDEALCISNLLGLDPKMWLTTPQTVEDRMALIWQTLSDMHGGLPQEIVLLNYPKLKKKGYTWAPRTLLAKDSTLRVHRWRDSKLAPVTTDGLRVRYPGFFLTIVAEKHGISDEHAPRLVNTNMVDLNNPLIFRDSNNRLVNFSFNPSVDFARDADQKTPLYQELFGRSLAIVEARVVESSTPNHTEKQDIGYSAQALLGEVNDFVDGTPLFTTICPVWLFTENQSFKPMYEGIETIVSQVLQDHAHGISVEAEPSIDSSQSEEDRPIASLTAQLDQYTSQLLSCDASFARDARILLDEHSHDACVKLISFQTRVRLGYKFTKVERASNEQEWLLQ